MIDQLRRLPAPVRLLGRRLRRGGRAAPVLGVVAMAVLAAGTASSGGAFTAKITNSTDTLGTRTYFSCAGAVAAASPLVYYALNETSGSTASDSSGNSRPGTYQGTVTRGVTRACVRDSGSAVTLNGSSGYVSSNATLTCPVACSEELWFRSTSTNGGLLTGLGSSSTGGSLALDRAVYLTSAGKVVFGVVNGLGKVTVASPTSYNDGGWHHVLATSGASGLRLYVDGSQVDSSPTPPPASSTGYVRIGYDSLLGWSTGLLTGYYLAGTMDEVAFYSRTLTAAEAASHHAAGIA